MTGFGAAVAVAYRNIFTHFEYQPAAATMPHDETGQVVVRYRTSGGEGTVSGEVLTVDALQVDVTKGYAESLVPNATRFIVGGRTYVDRAGVLYYNLNPATGAGTLGRDRLRVRRRPSERLGQQRRARPQPENPADPTARRHRR